MDERFWPFPIMKPEGEWDAFDRDYIDFMRKAYAENYRPREEGACTCVSLGDWNTGRIILDVFQSNRTNRCT